MSPTIVEKMVMASSIVTPDKWYHVLINNNCILVSVNLVAGREWDTDKNERLNVRGE